MAGLMVVTMMMVKLTWKPFTSWLWRTKWWKNLCTWSIIYTMWLSDVVERWWKHKIFPQKPASEVPHCFAMLLSNLVITILSGSKKKSVAKGAKIKMFTSSAIGRDGVWNTPRHISRRHSCGFFILIEVFSIWHSFMFLPFLWSREAWWRRWMRWQGKRWEPGWERIFRNVYI